MASNRGNRRLERRSEREARLPGQAPRPQRERQRPQARRASGTGPNWTLIGGSIAAVAVAALIVFAVIQTTSAGNGNEVPAWRKAELNDDPSLPGVYVAPHPGFDGQPETGDERQHVGEGVRIPLCTQEQIAANSISRCYHSNPPTSGPHAASPMPFTVLQNPAPKENLIHNMEHGGVVVWYNTDNQEVIRQLEAVVRDQLDRRRLVVMSRYTEMETDTIALTSWTRLDKFPVADFTKKRVEDFISEHQRRFNPEGL